MPAQSEREQLRTRGSAAALLSNAAVVLLLLGVVALQWRTASLLLGSSLQGDEAKHYTNGVLAFDYLRHGIGTRPVQFAEDFEVRYPLVSIGQWPPMYYAIQAAFYFLAGPSIRSGQVLSALMAACLALLLFLSLRARHGAAIALIGAGIFLAAPLVQAAAWEVMSDLLTGLFVYLAILSFAKLLDGSVNGAGDKRGNWKAAGACAAWAVAAILSKGSAWALGPFFLFAPLLARRCGFFKSRWFLGPMLAMGMLGSLFYLLAARMGIGYPTDFYHYLSVGVDHRLLLLRQLLQFAPLPLLGVGFLGGLIAIHARWRRGDDSRATTLSLVAAAWIASQLLFLFVLPMTFEPRVLLPSLAPIVVLAACFLVWLKGILQQKLPVLAAVAPAILGLLVLADCVASSLYRVDGFRQAANLMPYPADGALILVATNYEWGGEEEIITERLSHDPAHRDVILRGVHVLADLDASGNDQPLFQNAEDMRAYLLQMPVRFVVLSSPPYDFSFQALIDSAVTGDPKDFHLMATVPLVARPDGKPAGALRIFENPAGRDRHPNMVQTRLGYQSGRRTLTYHWK